jgi:hypothetical protein
LLFGFESFLHIASFFIFLIRENKTNNNNTQHNKQTNKTTQKIVGHFIAFSGASLHGHGESQNTTKIFPGNKKRAK